MRVLKKIIALCRARKVYRAPKKASVLVYDRMGSEIFSKYFSDSDMEILDVRGETINVYIMIRAILVGKFTYLGYLNKYIEYIEPTIVITFIDNGYTFFRLKNFHCIPKFIVLQNGERDLLNINHLKKLSKKYNDFKADYIFVFNKEIGRLYKSFVDCEIVSIGSFKNNMISKREKKIDVSEKKIFFVSQYREDFGEVMFCGKKLVWKDFYSLETILLPLLKQYCLIRGFGLFVLGAGQFHSGEKNFYENILGGSGWQFIDRSEKDTYSSYYQLQKADYIIGIDSTLLFEVLGRKNRVGVFCARDFNVENGYSFGWHANFPKKGVFWTNEFRKREFDRIMEFVVNGSDKEWGKVYQNLAKGVMEYDKGNTQFVALMRKLKAPLI